ncbi:MAG: transcriptional regulator [Alcanivorax sp.]|nr:MULTISPECIES: XRE family transcriptional regulator [Alcanivorax]MAC13299.1 transcriptional regulator [Alcanivorax sp.]MBG32351.1 transcriptional regulator [Alcanivorax sp.]MDF1636371.1 XRE family transcriptional regulator [Alcanivorax jadensis]
MNQSTFTSVWDAIEDDPAEREDLKARSDAIIRLKAHIAAKGWDAETAAAELQVNLFLVECLLKGRIGQLDRQSLAAMQRAAGIRR